MSKTIDLGVEKDHIESLTRANGITAISELIWNALDADATEIKISYKKKPLGNYEYISISDNGHGLKYDKALQVFGSLGGSEKKIRTQSPNGRLYHGKEGKGRLKSLALGDYAKFTSNFYKNGKEQLSEFNIELDRNRLSKAIISDLKSLPKNTGKRGVTVEILNVNKKQADEALHRKYRRELEHKFSSYFLSYPDFIISFNGDELDFKSLIKNNHEKSFPIDIDGTNHLFTVKILEWNFPIEKKKTYLCNSIGAPFLEINLGVRSPIPISIFIQSDYIELLHRDNKLLLGEINPNIIHAHNEAKKIAKEYIKKEAHRQSFEYIKQLKKDGLYPFKDKPKSLVEKSKQQVFDIVALQVHEYLPDFDLQDIKSKKLTFSLIKESLEKDATALQRILSEVIGLPDDKREELVEILEETSLSSIIDSITEIKNRLNFINGLEQLIYHTEINQEVKERKHLHKIIVNETWIFGDNFTYGADDITLKNVLKNYLQTLGRKDFQEVVDGEDNKDLMTIPDVCLWQQFSMGSAGKENLVIELKKPNLKVGFTEKSQIESYASKVVNDSRFPKDKTKWKFILLAKDFKDDIKPLLEQSGREYGHIIQNDNFDVFILTWGRILNEAKIRLEFIKNKLNMNLKDNKQGLKYLKDKYKEYLPDDF